MHQGCAHGTHPAAMTDAPARTSPFAELLGYRLLDWLQVGIGEYGHRRPGDAPLVFEAHIDSRDPGQFRQGRESVGGFHPWCLPTLPGNGLAWGQAFRVGNGGVHLIAAIDRSGRAAPSVLRR